MNKKINCIGVAKKQFLEDLQKDIDFLNFKKTSFNVKECYSYGVINAAYNNFVLNNIGVASESLISEYQKQISSQRFLHLFYREVATGVNRAVIATFNLNLK